MPPLVHFFSPDFFNAAVNASLVAILAALVIVYNLMLGTWTLIYYATWRCASTRTCTPVCACGLCHQMCVLACASTCLTEMLGVLGRLCE